MLVHIAETFIVEGSIFIWHRNMQSMIGVVLWGSNQFLLLVFAMRLQSLDNTVRRGVVFLLL